MTAAGNTPAARDTAAWTIDWTSAEGTAARDSLPSAVATPAASGRETPAHQPVPQSEPASGQPALDGRHRPIELTGRLVVRHALEVAKLDRAAVLDGRRSTSSPTTSRRSRCSTSRAWIIGRRRRSLGYGSEPRRRPGSEPESRRGGRPIEPAAERAIAPRNDPALRTKIRNVA